MDEEQVGSKSENAGAPAWVMTFADLMSLLMCFFVLLLSFSEMDAQKYKELAGSLKAAFGVQRDIAAHQIPRGTSALKRHFSPGRPEPTIRKKIQQSSSVTEAKNLNKDGMPGKGGPSAGANEANAITQGTQAASKNAKDQLDKKAALAASKEKAQGRAATENDAKKIAKALAKEIKQGKVELETKDRKIIIRVLEKGSFGSGFAQIQKDFKPVMKKMRESLNGIDGMIKITGHTDDLAIHNDKFRSNWELSAARAVSVAHELMENKNITMDRFEIIGVADTKPRAPNDSEANRAKNRRVEIVIHQGEVQVNEEELSVSTNERRAIQKNAKHKPQLSLDRTNPSDIKPANPAAAFTPYIPALESAQTELGDLVKKAQKLPPTDENAAKNKPAP